MVYENSNEQVKYIGDKNLQPMTCTAAGITYPTPEYKNFCYPAKEYVFEFVKSGIGYIETYDGIIEVSAGTLCIVRKGANLTFYSSPTEPYEKIWIKLDGKTVESLFDFFSLGDVSVCQINVLNYFIEILDQLSRITENKITESYIEILTLLFKMLSYAKKDYMFPKSHNSERLSEKIYNYINANIYSDISLDMISEAFNISKMHIIRIFKKEYGRTPMQYMGERKIEIAKSLLKGTVMPIKEIADLLKYSNAQHFSSVFKTSVGCTPNQYRKTN